MSLSLDLGTVPPGLEIKTMGPILTDGGGAVQSVRCLSDEIYDPPSSVHLGVYEITYEDFAAAVEYFLCNDAIWSRPRTVRIDPRLKLIRRIQQGRVDERGHFRLSA